MLSNSHHHHLPILNHHTQTSRPTLTPFGLAEVHWAEVHWVEVHWAGVHLAGWHSVPEES